MTATKDDKPTPSASKDFVELQCPSCNKDLRVAVHATVDISEHPELLDRIKDQTLQQASCEHCGATFSIQAPFLFLHPQAGILVQVAPPADLSRWREIEETLGTYADTLRFGEGTSPDDAQDADASDDEDSPNEGALAKVQRRLVFGLNHLNEKIFLAEHGFDDRSIELLKLSLLATREDLAQHLRGAAPEFLVEGLAGNDLVFMLLTHDAEGRASRAQLPVPRKVYEAVERDADFAKNFAELADAWFVSWLRYVEFTTPDTAPQA